MIPYFLNPKVNATDGTFIIDQTDTSKSMRKNHYYMYFPTSSAAKTYTCPYIADGNTYYFNKKQIL